MDSALQLLRQRVDEALDRRSTSWRAATGGYTHAQRWGAAFSDGSSCFVKGAVDDDTAEWLRSEHNVYSQLPTEPFLAEMIGWLGESGDLPILLLEDLSHAFWPPPWDWTRVDLVRSTLAQIHNSNVSGLTPVRDAADLSGWEVVGNDPEPLLRLGLVSKQWLRASRSTLLAAAQAAPIDGDDVLHLDVRSDNICFAGKRAVFIDWNVCLGNGDLDLAAWAPSLKAEGGPEPEHILPHAPEFAALMAGYFAARAGLPAIPRAPRVREAQLSQLRAALPWAQRALGLPPLDGPNRLE